jgi:hypothetical protein
MTAHKNLIGPREFFTYERYVKGDESFEVAETGLGSHVLVNADGSISTPIPPDMFQRIIDNAIARGFVLQSGYVELLESTQCQS